MIYHVSINDNGTFLPAYKMHGMGGYHLAGVYDVDGNGFPDLIAGRTVHYSRQSLAIPPPASFTTTESEPKVFFDADGDGDVDLMDDPSQWQRNRGDGQFDTDSLTNRARSLAWLVALRIFSSSISLSSAKSRTP